MPNLPEDLGAYLTVNKWGNSGSLRATIPSWWITPQEMASLLSNCGEHSNLYLTLTISEGHGNSNVICSRMLPVSIIEG